MPFGLLKAYLAMMPRIKSKEALEHYEILSLAAPSPQSKGEQRQRQEIHRGLQKGVDKLFTSIGKPKQKQREFVKTPEETLQGLAAMGFEVVQQ